MSIHQLGVVMVETTQRLILNTKLDMIKKLKGSSVDQVKAYEYYFDSVDRAKKTMQ